MKWFLLVLELLIDFSSAVSNSECLKLTRDLRMSEFVDWVNCADVFYAHSFEKLENRNHCSLIPSNNKLDYPFIFMNDGNKTIFKYSINDELKIKTIQLNESSFKIISRTGKLLSQTEPITKEDLRGKILGINIITKEIMDEGLTVLYGCFVDHYNCRYANLYKINSKHYRFDIRRIILTESNSKSIDYEKIVKEMNENGLEKKKLQHNIKSAVLCINIKIFLRNCSDFHSNIGTNFENFLKIFTGIGIVVFVFIFGLILIVAFD